MLEPEPELQLRLELRAEGQFPELEVEIQPPLERKLRRLQRVSCVHVLPNAQTPTTQMLVLTTHTLVFSCEPIYLTFHVLHHEPHNRFRCLVVSVDIDCIMRKHALSLVFGG